MTATEVVDRYLRHGLLPMDRVVVRERRPVERVFRSDTKTLRANFYRSSGHAAMGPDHHIDAFREVPRLTAERKLEMPGPSMTKYAPYWRWLVAIGLAAPAIGLIIGIAAPGPLTGVVFPIGITLLLVVAYAARPRSNAPSTVR